MDDSQDSNLEIQKISLEELRSDSKAEILKKQLVLGTIALLVMLTCTAILRLGNVV